MTIERQRALFLSFLPDICGGLEHIPFFNPRSLPVLPPSVVGLGGAAHRVRRRRKETAGAWDGRFGCRRQHDVRGHAVVRHGRRYGGPERDGNRARRRYGARPRCGDRADWTTAPLADSIANQMTFMATFQSTFVAASRAKHLLLDIGRVDAKLKGKARLAAYHAAVEQL